MVPGEGIRHPATGGCVTKPMVAAIAVASLLAYGIDYAHGQNEPTRFALYGQATYIGQKADGFQDPYSGRNSLLPDSDSETTSATLYIGARLWSGAELWVNPEADEGSGLDNTVGLAGFPNGASGKVGSNPPYFRLQRAFLRQTINLGGAGVTSDAGPNQLPMPKSSDRLIVTLGKLSVVDIFDNNRYAHDPLTDFLNWSVIDAGNFDYAADAWGYSVGGAAEWYVGSWAWRAGVFDLSNVPNSETLEPGFNEYQLDLEAEHRHELLGRPGKVDLTVFENRGRMALLRDAIAYGEANGVPPDPAPVRRYGKRDGIFLNAEQQLTADIGVFARLGDAGGNTETYEFTDIDRTASLGMSVRGARWHRPEDTVALAGVVNAISRDRRQYLAAGGLGILVGDGRLPHAGHESIVESYYRLEIVPAVHATLDYQWVGNPAYNRDRGPVSIFAVRIHVEL
jgi:high affinity Mn2+ porin